MSLPARAVVVLLLCALAVPARADERDADAEAEMTRADAYMAQEDWDAAVAHYNAARLLAPERPGPYRGLGMAYYAAGRCREAIPALERYVEIKQDNPWPRAVSALADCRARLAPRPAPQPRPSPPVRAPEREAVRPAPVALDPAAAERLRAARIEYERNRIDVCGSGGSYEFCTVHGHITENEFIRRFKKLTGSHELDRSLTLRNKGAIAVWATLGLLSVGAVAAGATIYNTPCQSASDDAACRDPDTSMLKVGATYTSTTAKYLLYIGLAAWATSTLGYLIYGGLAYDGKPSDHRISEYDARLFVEQHNRALDARIRADSAAQGAPLPPAPLGDPAATSRREPDRSGSFAARLRLVPYLGVSGGTGALGLSGRF